MARRRAYRILRGRGNAEGAYTETKSVHRSTEPENILVLVHCSNVKLDDSHKGKGKMRDSQQAGNLSTRGTETPRKVAVPKTIHYVPAVDPHITEHEWQTPPVTQEWIQGFGSRYQSMTSCQWKKCYVAE
jgi:hypothetical protein